MSFMKKGKKQSMKSKIEPFIRKGFMENGKVNFNSDGLTKPQIDFLNGVKNKINSDIQNKELTNLFSLCVYSSKDDFFGGCFEVKDDVNHDELFQEYLMEFEVKHPPQILPKNKVSEHLYGGGLTSFQHQENNKYFERIWDVLQDGGYHLNPTSGKKLIKVELENGFTIQ